ncbi:hypothetical protein BDN70DRAFT_900134 [Pholiota conissans]|uniref:Uncharacterized protein n=1 Tax=Pholiota conissans TaxID=109636 RepID=A0A9P5YQN2_9AGAR|nr:hypothetical protein BDN70DRAFT_900134 [Pholiota conissans]
MIHSMVFLDFCPFGSGVGDLESDGGGRGGGGIEFGYEYLPEHGACRWNVRDVFFSVNVVRERLRSFDGIAWGASCKESEKADQRERLRRMMGTPYGLEWRWRRSVIAGMWREWHEEDAVEHSTTVNEVGSNSKKKERRVVAAVWMGQLCALRGLLARTKNEKNERTRQARTSACVGKPKIEYWRECAALSELRE